MNFVYGGKMGNILKSILIGFALIAFTAIPSQDIALAAGQTNSSSTSKYDYMKRFSKAYDLIRNSYVREVPNEEIMNGAIKGMLQNLDPHSSFLDKDEFDTLQETTSGEFFGIGIEMTSQNNQLMVVTPIEDTPAARAGLKAGDLILAVDGESTQEMSTQEAATKIRGPKGTEVKLLILHKEDKSPSDVVIKRDAIPLISVKAKFLDEDGYAWVRVTRFSEKTTTELRSALKELEKKSQVKGIVLDLRNNPGGLLKQSVSVANAFIPKGNIVSMRGRGDVILENHNASALGYFIKCPVVALVNQGSASAAEIVAGALQDHKRALIIGETSFGKGSVQNIIPLEDSTAIKLTIALYYTPDGRSIQAEGIVPDIMIPFEIASDEKKPNFTMPTEKDLSGHLETGDKGKAKKDKKDEEKLVDEDARTMLEKDNQIRMGLQLVKGLPRMSEIKI